VLSLAYFLNSFHGKLVSAKRLEAEHPDEVDGEDRGQAASRCSRDTSFGKDGSRIRKNQDIVALAAKQLPEQLPSLSR
jgi:hypothetical protein